MHIINILIHIAGISSKMTNKSSEIQFSEDALNEIAQLIAEEGDSKLNFRIYITGGGCSGFQYGMTFDPLINEDDFVMDKKITNVSGVSVIKIVVDSISYPYLKNIRIEMEQSPKRFKIINKDVKTTCGCGSSFSLDDE